MELLNNRQMFDLEITTRCNKQCYICPRRSFTRHDRDMSLDTFEKVCEWLPWDCDAYFAGYGEPLLHKDITIFIEKLSQKNIRPSILTNGKLLSHNKIHELYESGLHKLQISILLKHEEEMIAKYVEMIDRKFYSKAQFNLLYDESIKKPEAAVNALKELGFKIYYKHIHSRGGELYKNKDDCAHDLPCGTFLSVIYIDTNGSLQICSNDINGKHNLGNIETMAFEDFMEKKRQLSQKGVIAPICKLCDDEYRLLNLQKLRRKNEQ